MSDSQKRDQLSRRRFLKTAAATAVAATATGAGAAVLTRRSVPTEPTFVAPPEATPIATDLVLGEPQTGNLQAQLVTTQAENVRLQAALDAAQRSLNALQSTNDERDQLSEDLALELSAATDQIGLLSGLVALYEQLDEADLGTLVDDGLAAVTGSIEELVAQVPALSDGLEIGQQALAEFEEHIPLLAFGRDWMEERLNTFGFYYQLIGTLLEEIVERAGPFLDMLAQWFSEIQKWLPFGFGQRTAEVMESLTMLLAEVPDMMTGMKTNVGQPLDHWLAAENEELPVRSKLIRPLREQVMRPAEETTERARQVQAVYRRRLAQPVQTAVANRRDIQTRIVDYRQKHQV